MDALFERAENKCELCARDNGLEAMEVSPSNGSVDQSLLTCKTCREQIANEVSLDPNHWQCLTTSMWSEAPAVQVVAWRMLNRLRSESWAAEQLEMLYLDEVNLAWAQEGQSTGEESDLKHIDSNGAQLASGDSVTLIKDLNVKGAGFTAKRGTTVRNISLVQDNEKHIEGRVSGQQIVILTEFVKKA